mmetsp:Transcript_49382/g.142007  ORF Transcript_49382/g.142007 Transcript_49382/m.142007 type:complete len:218 (+) Transcript_49382:1147-1800(+)
MPKGLRPPVALNFGRQAICDRTLVAELISGCLELIRLHLELAVDDLHLPCQSRGGSAHRGLALRASDTVGIVDDRGELGAPARGRTRLSGGVLLGHTHLGYPRVARVVGSCGGSAASERDQRDRHKAQQHWPTNLARRLFPQIPLLTAHLRQRRCGSPKGLTNVAMLVLASIGGARRAQLRRGRRGGIQWTHAFLQELVRGLLCAGLLREHSVPVRQ